jgi:hypothetical protein
MNAIDTPTVHYRLVPESGGIKLEIWEPTNNSKNPRAPYHFFVSYQLSSAEEAQHVLDQYLLDNDVSGAVCAGAAGLDMAILSTRSQTYA